MESSRAVGALDSFTPPQEYISCTNRFPGLASSYLDAFPQQNCCSGSLCPFVRFTVTGVARSFHPHSLGKISFASAFSSADAHAIHLPSV